MKQRGKAQYLANGLHCAQHHATADLHCAEVKRDNYLQTIPSRPARGLALVECRISVRKQQGRPSGHIDARYPEMTYGLGRAASDKHAACLRPWMI